MELSDARSALDKALVALELGELDAWEVWEYIDDYTEAFQEYYA